MRNRGSKEHHLQPNVKSVDILEGFLGSTLGFSHLFMENNHLEEGISIIATVDPAVERMYGEI